MTIAFICTGNICRSPVAAIIFREHLRRAGLGDLVEVTSAGTGGWHVGDPADPRAARSLTDNGYPVEHSAAQVDEDHLGADLLVALDSGHARALRRLVDDPDRVRLLRSFDPDADGVDVPDPYYGDEEGFALVIRMVEAAVPGLLAWTREHL
ncbi:low molecular weight protein-tyrosine-phosphatase [Saccharothrix longispora]|uniref:low molecular weight protein-tyrosine-phosphatase n=1 Tax=Saccharothrix longispora TaxID=33920 RepID=UPI0028FD7909|nr:low molecular weight protein-tyrosine-phosphatase [Saccharothrix longispora]MBY8847975.1 low molecular weight phosphotyrosine protein phosphatase [Saccharothrix sp. MB29]MDU0291278.1 low molecular weight protein-tyrosine-phosphatase [Saccharothrix longispora]